MFKTLRQFVVDAAYAGIAVVMLMLLACASLYPDDFRAALVQHGQRFDAWLLSTGWVQSSDVVDPAPSAVAPAPIDSQVSTTAIPMSEARRKNKGVPVLPDMSERLYVPLREHPGYLPVIDRPLRTPAEDHAAIVNQITDNVLRDVLNELRARRLREEAQKAVRRDSTYVPARRAVLGGPIAQNMTLQPLQ